MAGTHPQNPSSRNVGPPSRTPSNYTPRSNTSHPQTSHQQPQVSQSNITPTSHQPLTTQAMQAHNLHQTSLHQDPSYLTTLQQGQAHLLGSALASIDGFGDPLPQYLHARVVYETPGMTTMERFETCFAYPLRIFNEYEASFDGVCEDLQQQAANTPDVTTMERFEYSSSYPSRSLSEYEVPLSKPQKHQVSTPELETMRDFEPESSLDYQVQHPSPTPPHHNDQISSKSSTHPQPPSTPQHPSPPPSIPNPTYPSYPPPIDQSQTLPKIGSQFPHPPLPQFQLHNPKCPLLKDDSLP